MRYMFDSSGHALLYCVKCLYEKRDDANQAVTVSNGDALCANHITVEIYAESKE